MSGRFGSFGRGERLGVFALKKLVPILVVLVLALLLASCAPGPNSVANKGDEAAGFWLGLWHGFIALFTFAVSLFNDKVSIYEVNNTGGWYNFGFLVGVMMFWGGGGGGAARGSRSR